MLSIQRFMHILIKNLRLRSEECCVVYRASYWTAKGMQWWMKYRRPADRCRGIWIDCTSTSICRRRQRSCLGRRALRPTLPSGRSFRAILYPSLRSRAEIRRSVLILNAKSTTKSEDKLFFAIKGTESQWSYKLPNPIHHSIDRYRSQVMACKATVGEVRIIWIQTKLTHSP